MCSVRMLFACTPYEKTYKYKLVFYALQKTVICTEMKVIFLFVHTQASLFFENVFSFLFLQTYRSRGTAFSSAYTVFKLHAHTHTHIILMIAVAVVHICLLKINRQITFYYVYKCISPNGKNINDKAFKYI